jgi:hypothetical protein
LYFAEFSPYCGVAVLSSPIATMGAELTKMFCRIAAQGRRDDQR